VVEMLATMDIPVLRVSGVEADDTITCYATRAIEEGFGVAIVSSDKDFFQLLQDNVMIWRAEKKSAGDMEYVDHHHRVYTAGHFEEEFRLNPSQWWDYQALMGDSIDNVPGVKGIGAKGAAELLQQFGTLDNLLENSAKICSPRYRKALSRDKSQEQARFSKDLVTLLTSYPLPDLQLQLSHFERWTPSKEQKKQMKVIMKRYGLG